MTAKGGTDYRVKMKLKIPDSLARDPAVFHGMAKRSKQTIEKFATEGLKTTKKKANWKTYFDAFYAILMPAILQSEAERFEGIEELKGMLDEILSKFTLKGEEGLYPKSASDGVPPFFVPGAMRDLVMLLGFDRCLAELRP